MAAHRKSDRRRDDLCENALRKRALAASWLGVDCHFGVDVEEGFTLASLIMRNGDLFLGDHDRLRLLVFGFSQLLTLRKRRLAQVGIAKVGTAQVF